MKKVVIIGGGIAGLTAGIFAQKNGFESIIVEKHHTLGGECTGWDRQGYHIDGCIHWLVGTKAGTPLRRLWDAVGALEGIEIYHPESFMVVEYDQWAVHFYRDLERLRSSWLQISPVDEGAINEMCGDIQRLHSFNMPTGKPLDMMGIMEKIRFMLSMKDVGPVANKYGKMTLGQLGARFKHPALRMAISSFLPEGNDSSFSLIFALGTFTGDNSSIPAGGSKALAMRMVDKYLSLGGTVQAACEVTELDIDRQRVRQAICGNGRSFAGDFFIAACDPNALYEKLLHGRYPDAEFEKRFHNPVDYPLASNVYVGVGYAGTMEGIPRTVKFPVHSIDINENGKPIQYVQMTHYGYEPDFAPTGHTVVTVAINQFAPELDMWQDLVRDKQRYQAEKARVGESVVEAIETRFPETKGKLRLLDVATPQTYQRYCNAYRGAFMGFWPTMQGKELRHNGKIRGLRNMVLSGQWLQPPGGLPIAVITGKDSIQRLCKQEKRPFLES